MIKYLICAASLLLSSSALAYPIDMQETPIREFAEWYSQQTGRSIAIDPKVSGNVTVYSADVTDEQLPEFAEGVFQTLGYTLVAGNPSRLVPASSARSSRPDFSQSVMVGSPSQQQQDPYEISIVPFNNVRASDIQPVVMALIESSLPGYMTPKVQALPSANALMIRAPADSVAQLRDLLSEIDVPNPQVLIRSMIVETTNDESFDFGVALGSAQGHDVAGGYNTNSLSSRLSVPGGSFGIFDGNILAFAAQAIRRNGNARILSTPQILTLSGSTGRFSAGQNVPFITGRVTGEAASVENPFQTIERRDIGTTLAVSPLVLSGGSRIVLDIASSSDSISDSQLASDIITNQRSLSTTVQVSSGQTLLLGGIQSSNTSESTTSVPFLSDIPLIGGLFSSRSSADQQRRLYVLIYAEVI